MAKSTELRWVFRPAAQPAEHHDLAERHDLTEHAGKEIYAVAVSPVPGCVEVTLTDGSRLRASRDEIVAA